MLYKATEEIYNLCHKARKYNSFPSSQILINRTKERIFSFLKTFVRYQKIWWSNVNALKFMPTHWYGRCTSRHFDRALTDTRLYQSRSLDRWFLGCIHTRSERSRPHRSLRTDRVTTHTHLCLFYISDLKYTLSS